MDSFDRQWERWFPPEGNKEPSKPSAKNNGTSNTTRVFIILAGALALFILISVLKGFYTEWLWFSSLSYGSVYTTVLKTKMLVFFSAAIIFAIVFLGNLVLATHLAPKTETHFWPWAIVRPLQKLLRWNVLLGTALLSLIFGLVAQGNWEVILRFFNGQPFGITDPVFHREIGFYVFSMPFLYLVKGWLLSALIITLLGSAGVYLLSYAAQRLKFDFSRPVLAHISGLAIAILGLFAWSYWLGIWELVFSERGVVFGASYADINAKLPAQWILLSVVVICIGLLLVFIWRRNHRWPLYGIGGWIVAAIIVGGIFPGLIQRFQVEPNELARETLYIEYNIESTREAFALNRIEEQPFLGEEAPSPQDITENEMTISNIRLWDPRPLKDTYNQLQSFRPYYDFNDVDIDRYTIEGNYRQVMLSARELTAEKLSAEAQTWVNRKLQFTHGYGVVMSPVNEISTQGLPNLLLQDIPPIGVIDVVEPRIYYGEKTTDYVIVKTKSMEFDYPMGNENVIGEYQGQGGVNLDSFVRRLLYAWQLGDLNILISSELTPESRILYYRNIRERVSRLAPFLELDRDPYLAVIEGRLFWIQDAYTTSDRYPYSEPAGNGLNYIRNSVKAVIDAYNGSVTFYVTEPEDALIRTYQAIFPQLFVSQEEMPRSLLSHIRYPEDMFKLQSSVYQSYHMRDARVFYNKEDLWDVPREVYFGSEQAMQPYYVIMRLPGEDSEEFLLMLPFTPVGKNVTVGWLAARCDGENYGKLLVYRFPKDRLVYGPSQIENRIGQDTIITEQLALWSRGGSRVIRGNLLLIPIGKSTLFVEPVFLEAETGGLPELKRVIVVAGDQIAMESTLEESIAAIFGAKAPPPEPETPDPAEPEKPVATAIASLIEEATQHYNQAQQYLQDGNWTGYGNELNALEAVLDKLAELTAEKDG
ncbi:UPF0182 family protein [Chloroflexota bacterium]